MGEADKQIGNSNQVGYKEVQSATDREENVSNLALYYIYQ